jgi:hypothetical protein
MNDDERRDWVDNDEGLYDLQRSSGQPMRTWIRENRKFIDEAVGNVTSGRQSAHYLKYRRY